MVRITPIHWKKFERFLLAVGCEFKREEGDHRVYWKKGILRPIIVPRDKSLPVFIIRNNLRVLSIGHEEYLKILSRV